MPKEDYFFTLIGLLSAGAGALVLLDVLPFSQFAGWFGLATGLLLLAIDLYHKIKKRPRRPDQRDT